MTSNTSDHLPLTVSLSYDVCSSMQIGNNDTLRYKRIDWVEAEKGGALDKFSSEIRTRIEPLLIRVYDEEEVISNEIEQVARLLIDTAEKILSCVQPRKKTKWKDDVLSHQCVQSQQAHATWRDAESYRGATI